jgi:Malectin domain
MKHFLLPPVDVDPDDLCDERVNALKKRTRTVPLQSSCCPWIHAIFFWTLLLIRCDIVQSFFLDKNGNPLSSLRQLQSTPSSSPAKTYVARRINAGGESEYIDTNGTSWGADNWYGNKGRRTTPSECTSDILNTTDDILYCSNRFYPVSIVDPPYRYNIPVPYSALYEVRLHFAEAVRNETSPGTRQYICVPKCFLSSYHTDFLYFLRRNSSLLKREFLTFSWKVFYLLKILTSMHELGL